MALGRDILFEYLHELGVKCLFGVPGTNEIPLIDGTSVPANEVRYVPCLHENIAVGAAMGYARASGKPGVVELHVTPGAAHGIGNLFNAYKSHIPVVVLCAQQHSELLLQEPLLASDLVRVAGQYTKWAWEVRAPEELGVVLQRAFKEALTSPCRPVFVSIPWEFTLAEVPYAPAHVTKIGSKFIGETEAVAEAIARLATAKKPIVVAGDGVGAAGAWRELERFAEAIGAPVYSETLSSYMNFPNHSPLWQGELPQTQAKMQKVFDGHDVAFLCGYNAQAQVLVYKYSLGPMIPREVAQVYLHDDPWEIGKNAYGEVAVLGDIAATLRFMLGSVSEHPGYDAQAAAARGAELQRIDGERRAALSEHGRALTERAQTEPIYGENVALALAGAQSEMPAPLMLSNEAVSDSGAFQRALRFEQPTDYFAGQGGSLGWSMPAALGMKLATDEPDAEQHSVVNVVGDGSALFYPHTWWTARKLSLAILYVITNNREYRTLLLGLRTVEEVYSPWKPSGEPWYLHLEDPAMDFVALANAFGIEGQRVSVLGELNGALRKGVAAVKAGRPYVIEVLVDPTLDPPKTVPRFDVMLARKEGEDAAREYIGPA
jgi:benzoylformate decarboxylase